METVQILADDWVAILFCARYYFEHMKKKGLFPLSSASFGYTK